MCSLSVRAASIAVSNASAFSSGIPAATAAACIARERRPTATSMFALVEASVPIRPCSLAEYRPSSNMSPKTAMRLPRVGSRESVSRASTAVGDELYESSIRSVSFMPENACTTRWRLVGIEAGKCLFVGKSEAHARARARQPVRAPEDDQWHHEQEGYRCPPTLATVCMPAGRPCSNRMVGSSI